MTASQKQITKDTLIPLGAALGIVVSLLSLTWKFSADRQSAVMRLDAHDIAIQELRSKLDKIDLIALSVARIEQQLQKGR